VDAGALPPSRIPELRSPEIKTFDAATGAKTPSPVTPSNEGMQKRLSAVTLRLPLVRSRQPFGLAWVQRNYRGGIGTANLSGWGVLPSERTLIGRR
jgi:hypothetical protein